MAKIVEINSYYSSVEKFKKAIAIKAECEVHKELLKYIRQFAYRHSKENFYKTYGFINTEDKVIAYISFSLSSIDKEDLPSEVTNIPPSHNFPISALKITKLLVSEDLRGQGLGTELVTLAHTIALILSHQVGCRLLLVDAKNKAIEFYKKSNFIISQKTKKDITLIFKNAESIKNADFENYIKFCKDYSLSLFETYLCAIKTEKEKSVTINSPQSLF